MKAAGLFTSFALVVCARLRATPPRTAWVVSLGATNHLLIARAGLTMHGPTPSDVTISRGQSVHSQGTAPFRCPPPSAA